MRSPTTRMYYKGKVVRVSWHQDSATPPEIVGARRSRRRKALAGLVILLLGMFVYWRIFADIPTDYEDIREHFKYGSIGAEEGNGIPYWIWKVLPEMFPEYLPDSGKGGYAALGFTVETGPGKPDTPIGFSKRRIGGVERVGLNCAVCHSSTIRASATAEPEVYLGMPAHKVDLLGYFDFLFKCARDERFSTDDLLARISPHVGPIDRLIYKIAIPVVKQTLQQRREQGRFMLDHPSGPGRIDTFTPYKTIQFGFTHTEDFSVGNADFPSLWNQKLRQNMNLHWDGDNNLVEERNISASIGAGATPISLDQDRLARVMNWIWTFPPPRYPWEVDKARAGHGASIYRARCAGCHESGAEKYKESDGRSYGVGEVLPIALIGTDRERLDSYTLNLTDNQYALGSGQKWRFGHFRKTDGYANMPLDGVWARSPYLHNGSVPTLRDLLEPPISPEELRDLGLTGRGEPGPDAIAQAIRKARSLGRRPPVFYRGNDVYDATRAGFVSELPEINGHRFSLYDARLTDEASPGGSGPARVRGNGNFGHTYGTDLPSADKDALVEYLKTL